MTYIRGIVPKGNEWPSWSDTNDIKNYHTLNSGECTGFGQKHTFCVDVHNSSYLYCLTIKHLINQDGEPTTPHKLGTGTEPSVSNLCVLFYHVLYGKRLHMLTQRHYTCVINHKRVWGIFVGITHDKKGHLIYVPITKKIVFSHCVVFEKTFSSALSYTSHPYSEGVATQPLVS